LSYVRHHHILVENASMKKSKGKLLQEKVKYHILVENASTRKNKGKLLEKKVKENSIQSFKYIWFLSLSNKGCSIS
jgi:transposase